MPDVAAAPTKSARTLKPMPKAEPAVPPLPQSPVPPTPLREALTHKLKTEWFTEAGQGRVRFEAKIPADWEYDDVLAPGFWINVLPKLAPNPYTGGRDFRGSFIDLGSEDHAFYAQLYIRDVTKAGLVVTCIGPCIDPATGKAYPLDLMTSGPWAGRKFAVLWNKEARGYDVVRKADGEVIASGESFPTADLAVAWAVAEAKKAA